MNAHAYRYVFADILTGRPVRQLPVSGVRWDRRLSQAGTFTGKVQVTDAIAADVLRVLDIDQAPHALHVWRDKALAWSGIITQKTPSFDGDTAVVNITGVTWEGYASRTMIQSDLAYTGVDVYSVADALWQHLQGRAGGNVRVAAAGNLMGRVADDISWLSGSSKHYSDALADLVKTYGFEWRIDYDRDPTTGIYSGRLKLGDPLGQAADTSPHVLLYTTGGQGNSITGWTWAQNLDTAATAVQGVGGQDPDLSPDVAAIVDPILSTRVWESSLLATGLWLRIDGQVQDNTVIDPNQLDALAVAQLEEGAWSESPQINVDLDQTTFQPGSVGDYVRLIIQAPHLQVRESRRVIGVQATVNDDGSDQVTLVFEGDASAGL